MRIRILVSLAFLATLIAAQGCDFGKSNSDLANDAVQRGLEAHFAGRTDEAKAAYHEVLDLDPRNPYAFYNLGVIEGGQGHDATAENYYRLAIASDANFVPALYNLAVLRSAAGATDEAISFYRSAINADPGNAEAHLNLGFALWSVGRRPEGDAELQLAAQLKPALASRIPVLTPEPSE